MTHLTPPPAIELRRATSGRQRRSWRSSWHSGGRRCLAAALLATVAAGSWAAPLDDIRRQVEGSQFEQAYQTALANPQLIGDVHFDFLYGVAAINVGRVPEGLLALERHLAAVPANDRARLELARGYFLLGEYTRARSEFEFVLRYNPPAGVRANINGFLQAMQVRESTDRRATARLYVEAGGGYDNNVNGGTFRDEIALVFGNISLAGSPSQQVADGYGQVVVGGQQLLRVSNRMSVFAGGDLDHRANSQERQYDLSTGSVYIGFSQLSGAALWRATLGTSTLLVGGNRYRDLLQLSTEANFTLSQETTLMGFAQYGEQRYAGSDEVRDARATTFGAMVTYNPAQVRWQPSLGLRVSFTQEDNQRLRRDLAKQMPLLRVFASATPIDRMRVSVGLVAYQQKFDGADIGFGTVREDDAVGADVVVNYALDANWTIRGDAQWTVARSNQDLYDSSRKAVSLKLRYQF